MVGQATKLPLVSIVVPIYNVEQYLEECFESIIAQSYENIEIILVDDGATDSSGKIADSLAKSHDKTQVIHKKNGGLSDARNAGMKRAKGEYITFVDSDDCIDQDFVKNLVECAVENDAGIAQGNNSRHKDDLGNGTNDTETLTGVAAFVELMKFKMISPTAWGKLYKKSLFTDNNLEFPVGRIHEDTAVLYKLVYLAENVTCIDKILYYYRVNGNSIMTANYTEKHYSSVVKYHQELDEFIDDNKIDINEKIIYKHKALRLLSVLNKLALHRKESADEYKIFARDYKKFTMNSLFPIGVIGLIPVAIPGIFRGISSVTPKIRKILGKM